MRVGSKVKCVNSKIRPEMLEEVSKDFENWVKEGVVYTVRGLFDNDGIVSGVVLEELCNVPKYFRLIGRVQEPAFATWRFKELDDNLELDERKIEYELN